MDGISASDRHSALETVSYSSCVQKEEGSDQSGAAWYLNRREIEENSPSRRDGIDLKKEAYLRKSYCTFLQDLGMKLKVPQVTIATAIIFCHRFFLRQSHAKNDRRTIATVCMFLAGKVEETPRPLKDVIIVSYEIIHKKDPSAAQRIKQKELYEQQKELILLGERAVLATLNFDLNVQHPYKPLVEAIKKFKVAQNALAQVAWNFVNDGLRTSLCLQFKPHHIAAGAIFLSAKFLAVKLPSDGEKVWWQEFDVTPRQLEEVSNQMLELYEQNRTPSHGTVTDGNSAGTSTHRPPSKAHASVEETIAQDGHVHAAATPTSSHAPTSSRSSVNQPLIKTSDGNNRTIQTEGDEHNNKEVKFAAQNQCSDVNGNTAEALNDRSDHETGEPAEGPVETEKVGKSCGKESTSTHNEGLKGNIPVVPIDKDKVKAALEKRRKSRTEAPKMIDLMDEDDLIERALEDGVELAAEDGKNPKQEVKQSTGNNNDEPVDPPNNASQEIFEQGKVDNGELKSPEQVKKRKVSTTAMQMEEKEGYDLPQHQLPFSKHHDVLEDGMVTG